VGLSATAELLVDIFYSLSLVGTNNIFGTAEATVVKFCKQVGYVKFQHMDDKSHLKGTWSGSCDPF